MDDDARSIDRSTGEQATQVHVHATTTTATTRQQCQTAWLHSRRPPWPLHSSPAVVDSTLAIEMHTRDAFGAGEVGRYSRGTALEEEEEVLLWSN